MRLSSSALASVEYHLSPVLEYGQMKSCRKSDSIVLIGMAGVGKSTIGRLLADALGFAFTDLDEYIRTKNGHTVQEIIDRKGEAALPRIEEQRLYEVDLARRVVAPGGSIVYRPDLMEYLRRHAVLVYLDDSIENIEKRLTNATTRGIVGLKSKSLRQIYDERKPLYSRYADITVDCRGKSGGQIVSETLQGYATLRSQLSGKCG
ncbi:MAG: shikimate kinase [Dehalococcoidales bacterium]|nr:shikimate kinase [Dehalococcoidales bacterium]